MHLWQAKFFDAMGTSQWRQLTDSFTTALQVHPRMTEYTVCIPLDRQDPRIPDQQWFMDRWNLWVEERQQQAAEQGRTVTISPFGPAAAETATQAHV